MKYITKPVIIEAVRWYGDNILEIEYFMNMILSLDNDNNITIATLEGIMLARVGDYIIKGLKGEFYPCKPDIFDMKYEIYEEEEVIINPREDNFTVIRLDK